MTPEVLVLLVTALIIAFSVFAAITVAVIKAAKESNKYTEHLNAYYELRQSHINSHYAWRQALLRQAKEFEGDEFLCYAELIGNAIERLPSTEEQVISFVESRKRDKPLKVEDIINSEHKLIFEITEQESDVLTTLYLLNELSLEERNVEYLELQSGEADSTG